MNNFTVTGDHHGNTRGLILEEFGERIPVSIKIEGRNLMVLKDNTSLQAIVTTNMVAYNEREITLRKANNKLGFVYSGGTDINKLIKISGLIENSPASSNGSIHIGDVILHVSQSEFDHHYMICQINGEPVLNKKHDELGEMIKSINGSATIHLVSLQPTQDKSTGNADAVDFIACAGDNLWMKHHIVDLTGAHITKYHTANNKLRPNGFTIASSSMTLPFHAPQDMINELTDNISRGIIEANKHEINNLSTHFDLKNLLCFGCVGELVPSCVSSQVWVKKVLVLRSGQVEIYNKFPENASEWQKPEASYGICNVTWRTLSAGDFLPNKYRSSSLLLQSSTGGNHIISFEFDLVLKYWERQLFDELLYTVNNMKTKEFEGNWKNNDVIFKLDLQQDFMIIDPNTKALLWQKPFGQLKSSSDDGSDTIHLEFHHDSQRRELQEIKVKHLHAVLFTIEAFLKAKVDGKKQKF